ncbi:VWA domain-containing protein [Streptomyces sp. NBC_00247]|uniref:vWA domain-containing protein n=1 Tax=Streptomyces sp. NBC_00247 TaxID=2975689 RepID=UPI002E2BF09A|nr:vWA domain-containing protein [Streptomyces sp. NBC_00247]
MRVLLGRVHGTRLVIVAGDGLVTDNRVGVSAADMTAECTGLLLPAHGDERRGSAVRMVPTPDLPTGVVAVHEDLARATGLSGAAGEDWLLLERPATFADSVVLESAADAPPEVSVRQLRGSSALDGQVFRHEPEAREATWLYVDGVPYRVRSVADGSGEPLTGLLRIGAATTLHLFLPGNRTGVDVVILADCSGSMSWDDVLDDRDVGRFGGRAQRYVTRMHALKHALHEMADVRLSSGGRPTRLALVRFTKSSVPVFPRSGGMADLGDESTIEEFRAAVGLLKPESAGTDIGQALHHASELLHRYGNPHNERLVVLVSDGADWVEKGVDATGEMLAATADPVSLMEELNGSLGIRLHAVGVSAEATFWPWWERHHRRSDGEPHVSIVPNHVLLRHLVDVGGGDPTRIGGTDVLMEYFGELGAGVTRTVGHPQPGRLPEPQPEIGSALSLSAATATDARRGELAEKISLLYSSCVDASRRRIGRPLYRQTNDTRALHHTGQPVRDRAAFAAWVLDVHKVFYEQQESALNSPQDRGSYPIPGVADIIWDGRLFRIHTMRLETAHDNVGRNNKKQAEQHQRMVGEVFRAHTGRYHLLDDDEVGWGRLQLGLMEDLAGMLTDVYAVLNTEQVPAPAYAEAAQDGQAGGFMPAESTALRVQGF